MSIMYWTLAGLLLLQLVVSLLAWRQLARRLRDVTEAQQRAASTDVPTSMLVTGMARIEARLQQLETTRKSSPAPQPQSGDRAYELAQRMARNGAGAAQVAEACGLALHEAELLCRLHAPTRT
jgi:hypothetical protein